MLPADFKGCVTCESSQRRLFLLVDTRLSRHQHFPGQDLMSQCSHLKSVLLFFSTSLFEKRLGEKHLDFNTWTGAYIVWPGLHGHLLCVTGFCESERELTLPPAATSMAGANFWSTRSKSLATIPKTRRLSKLGSGSAKSTVSWWNWRDKSSFCACNCRTSRDSLLKVSVFPNRIGLVNLMN